jgi:hypothetical protein
MWLKKSGSNASSAAIASGSDVASTVAASFLYAASCRLIAVVALVNSSCVYVLRPSIG